MHLVVDAYGFQGANRVTHHLDEDGFVSLTHASANHLDRSRK